MFWGFVCLVLGFVLLIVIGGLLNGGTAPTESATAPADSADVSTAPAAETRPAPPQLRVTATNLAAAYDANEVAADNEFSGKRLEVVGFIASIDKGPFGAVHIRMMGTNEFQPVDATMKDGNDQIAAQLSRGEPVAVICGEIQRILGSVILSNCDFAPREESQPQQQAQPQPEPSAEVPVEPAAAESPNQTSDPDASAIPKDTSQPPDPNQPQ
jgi:hypothetical protein